MLDQRSLRISVQRRQSWKRSRGHVPWTRCVRPGKSDYYGEEIDLLEFIGERRDRLVLKPNDDYGGHGIYIGWNTDEIGWDEAIHNALGKRRLPGAGTRAHGARGVSGADCGWRHHLCRATCRSRSTAFQRKSRVSIHAALLE